ncbi:MAG: Rne/Rng family ribonuclease [candidate division Zixibacteria bacterium]|nr:Rne/Rng family ribonuclease [candidate division Zixibacteria bacterium]MDD5426120.1 Rne/Rng family ribonuclease [candidate division Zixibacteria bacterium]
MKKEILINSTEYEKRVAILEDDKLVELQVERADTDRMVGDIYKGKIKTVLPGMQAAFVDIGMEKAAYLHSSDIGKLYSRRYDTEDLEEEEAPVEIIRKTRQQGIENILKRNQEILVQIIKEPISTKGPRITSEISIPGRFMVLVPDDDHVRLSRKISNWNEKKRLKRIISPLRPEGFGLIIRTEAEGKEEKDFKNDLKRLLKLWTKLKKKADTLPAPALIHKESEMVISMIRDIFTDDVQRVLVDDRGDYKMIVSYARQVAPHLKDRVALYKGELPLFDLYDLEPEIDKMLQRKVWIKKGAYLIIDQTEAMVTIDVNTGRFVGRKDQEQTILETNLQAAKEIARQIRLRDIGGLIVCDFIDMYNRDNRRKLFEEYKYCFKNDRAKRGINPVTEFGLIEMTRERVRPSHMQSLSEPCPHCAGLGRIISKENMATKIERWFKRASADKKYKNYHLVVCPPLAATLVENGINRLERIMKIYKFKINLVRDTTLSEQEYKIYSAEDNTDLTEIYHV